MPDKQSTRFPNLGKLSLAILENLVEPILGEKAIDEIKTPVVQRELRDSLSNALELTEKRFVVEYKDANVREAILSLPVATMPDVEQAVQAFYSRPTDPTLAQVLANQITSDFPNLSPAQVVLGVTAYLRIIREELVNISGEVREKLNTLANLNVEDNTARMANTLDQMLERMSSKETVEQPILTNQTGDEGMSKRCFVIMPFSGTTSEHSDAYWTQFFSDFIKPSVENLGYSCERLVNTSASIITDIIVELLESDIVLAVLTDYNPNVWYELGVRHSFRNGAIPIIEKDSRIPFDIQDYGVIRYQDTIAGRTNFEKQLKIFIEGIEESNKPDNPVKKFFDQRPVKFVSAAPNAQSSPLAFFSALSLAKQRLLVIGQNLSTLATQARFKDAAFDALRQRPLDLQLLICDRQPDYIPKATRDFAGPTFIKDLEDALKSFKQWQEQADMESASGKMKGRLEIRLSTRIGNLSLTFVDPELDTGMLEITPVPFDSRAAARVRFLLSRRDHSEMFQAYWSAYDLIFRTGGSRSIREFQFKQRK
jgi:hypothetical protein